MEDWMTVDCEQCGAAFGEPCRSLGCGDTGCTSSFCAATAGAMARGEAFHAGGNRERATLGIIGPELVPTSSTAMAVDPETLAGAARHAETQCPCGWCWQCRCAAAVAKSRRSGAP